ncbi:MAG: hypothetical protein QNJ16_09405 [Rhodobacter sp.]|nr:hypothetical protein [Rhodobacter sp.]
MDIRRQAAVTLVVLVLAATGRAQAQDCTGGLCTEVGSWQADVVDGEFRHGFEIAAGEIDLLAALEQQRWREVRFQADHSVRIYAALDIDGAYRPQDWPEDAGSSPLGPALTLLFSPDGNAYRRIASGDPVPEGSVVSVIVGQDTKRAEGGAVTFFPARWTLSVSARRTWVAADGPPATTAGPLLSRLPDDPLPDFDPLLGVPAALDAVDCLGADCPTADSDAPAEAVPVRPRMADGADELAAELQAELARVGCYGAAVDGLWGPASRAAMTAFNRATGAEEAANAPSARALVAVARVAEVVCASE